MKHINSTCCFCSTSKYPITNVRDMYNIQGSYFRDVRKKWYQISYRYWVGVKTKIRGRSTHIWNLNRTQEVKAIAFKLSEKSNAIKEQSPQNASTFLGSKSKILPPSSLYRNAISNLCDPKNFIWSNINIICLISVWSCPVKCWYCSITF